MRLSRLFFAGMLAVASILPSFAQNVNEQSMGQRAVYVHRNDGEMTAVMTSTIKSMQCSKIDLDGMTHEDFVVQEIQTTDSLYRIPLEAIDSIYFQTPSNILKNGVVEITSSLMDYLVKVEELNLYLRNNIPGSILPKIGDKLVTPVMSEILPNGFIGEVESVAEEGEFIIVRCNHLDVPDVYDRFYYVVEGYCPDERENVPSTKSVHNGVVHLEEIAFEETIDIGVDWSETENSKFGVGTSVGYGFTTTPTLRYIYACDNGDWLMNLRIDFEHECSVNGSLYGGFKYDNDIKLAGIDIPLEVAPFIKVYAKAGPRVAIDGSLAFEFERTETYTSRFNYSLSSNSNVKRGLPQFGNIRHVDSQGTTLIASGNISFYVGAYLEVGVGLLKEDMAKVYGRADAGLELSLEADLGKSIDNAPVSTDLYDNCGELAELNLNFCYGVSAGASASIGDLGIGVSYGDMLKIQLFNWGLFPEFSNTSYLKENDGKYLYTEIGKNLMAAVPVGFKVFDEDGELLHTIYSDTYYKSGNFENYRLPYSYNRFNKHAYAYPVFKLFDQYEILASPRVDVINKLTPSTDGNNFIGADMSVDLHGSLKADSDDADFSSLNGLATGFLFGNSVELESLGNRINADADDKGMFSSNVEGLEYSTTYYYCAFLDNGEETYYGDTKSFTTPDCPPEAVDLGLSVLWAKLNIGSSSEGNPGGLYGWADPTGSETSVDVIASDGNTWISNLYGGANPPTNICGSTLDIATAQLGGSWRLPTQDEIVELIDNCQTEWTSVDGYEGMRFTGPNGNSIFLPAGGNRFGTQIRDSSIGYYWTGTLNTEMRRNAYRLVIDSFYGADWDSYSRYLGCSVRAVMSRPETKKINP